MINNIQSVNCYEKNNKKFLVIVDNYGNTIFINVGLINYAIEHSKPVKEKK